MKIFKKIILSVSILFMSPCFVSAVNKQFVVQICNVINSECSNVGNLLAYEIGDSGEISKIIIHRNIPYSYANELIRALNIFLPRDLDGVPIDLPLSRRTEKGNRIYEILENSHENGFERSLLTEFKNLKKFKHIFTEDLSSSSSECSPVSSPRARKRVFN